MATEGVDYAFPVSATDLAAAGKHFAMRYVGPGSDQKHLHPSERDALWQAGLSLVLLAEGSSRDALLGNSMGVEHATSAAAGAKALGAPDTVPIYFAIDFDVTSVQWPTVADYLHGCASVIGLDRVGIYASIWGLKWAALGKTATWFFQAFAPAWSGGTNGTAWPYAHVVQYRNNVALAGGTVDLCRTQVDVYGQWDRSGLAGKGDMDYNEHQKLDAVFNLYPKVKLDQDNIPDGKGTIAEFPVPLTVFLNNMMAKIEALSSPQVAPVDLEAVRKVVREEIDKSRLTS
jgi:hypothetical protein